MFLIYMSLETPRNNMIIKIIIMLMILLIMIIFEKDVVGTALTDVSKTCAEDPCVIFLRSAFENCIEFPLYKFIIVIIFIRTNS